ncbi:hypothetical protein [Streptomyces mirabilis]|uniref:Uncharacterized protein n=1 Tax=Streptomyces mirabilis TaxID=68239 RepID=A0ABU3V4S5_9ACTN|nr:hypothetical protein [Streptomyces mirabilis]MCX5355532.1 hypothetical protein [Streptomyces mirabilis]MDU9001179.1 hypothetical protein [Streptomyces mirabilis]
MSTPVEAPAAETADLVGRCYTHARRHPLVIGRFPGGGRLWGGPYTIPQAIVMAGSFVALIVFRPLWAHFGLLGNVIIAFAVPYALGFVVRKVNVDGRNPLAVAGSVLGLMAAPSLGRMGGRPLKGLGPRSVYGMCTVTWQTPAAPIRLPAASVLQDKPVNRDSTSAFAGALAAGTSSSSSQAAGGSPRGVQTAGRPQVLSAAGALLAARTASTTSTRTKGA